MGWLFSRFLIILFSNVLKFLRLVDSLANATNTTAHPQSKDTNDNDDESIKIKVAVIIGVGLTAIISGCIGFFLLRGYVQMGKYKNHKHLRKLKGKTRVSGRYGKEEECQTFAEEKL